MHKEDVMKEHAEAQGGHYGERYLMHEENSMQERADVRRKHLEKDSWCPRKASKMSLQHVSLYQMQNS